MTIASPTDPFDLHYCEQLVSRATKGEESAFVELADRLWPELLRIVASSRAMKAVGKSEDEVRNVVARLMDRLSRDRYHALRLYPPWRERHPDKTLLDWLRIVAANTARDYVRGQVVTPVKAQSDEPLSPTRLLNAFASAMPVDELGARPPMTAAQTARQLLEYAENQLPADQYDALSRWLQGDGFEEIATQMCLPSAVDARKVIRAAVASLRRRFA